ncbi:MAG: alpha-1,2-fucosyltransferase [Lachnospiraceae bacterium]|nr:alpha-1,2-fucosyltransferase [Lachnospiraceae bacterium]
MIILQMSGGLGNQMFQYALYLKLKKLGREVKFDDETSYELDNARPVQLAVFDITYPRATRQEVTDMRDSSPAWKDRIRRKLKGRNLKQYTEADYSYDEHIFELDDTYLRGYFQTEKYFSDMRDEIYKTFTMRKDLMTEQTVQYEEDILSNEQSVSIHIRRGDYMTIEGGEIYAGICTDEFYDSAIKHVLEKYPDAVFYLFTNDSSWAEYFCNIHSDVNIKVVEGNTEYFGYLDMYLMSRCRHHIVANSSFSWWGAWLGRDQSGMVIAPDPWFNCSNCADIHTDRMILINPKGELLTDDKGVRNESEE